MAEQPDWKNTQYLQKGNPRQRRAYAVLQELTILTTLSAFEPIVVGTIPIDVDLPGSDIDIICEVLPENRNTIKQLLRGHYDRLPAFQLNESIIGGKEALVCRFFKGDVQVEIFGQAQSTVQQFAYRHMVVEHAILEIGGEKWRAAVRRIKRTGLKTEPAFASLLRLPGNPYEALLTLEGMSTVELTALMTECVI